jgi:XTP/dITP diphosphohydrolase
MHTIPQKLEQFQRLLEIMTELRAKCPWDKEQTFESLRTLTIEETYELADAIIRDDKKEIRKELGDILLHIVFYAEIIPHFKQMSEWFCFAKLTLFFL